ncbi:hypothetical protein [Clostridium sp. C2-6-12]|uniref:anti-sigma-I factor RsgI family protein n=1 Tax=Clostridium sp. C2-6-12 TaxID=2698832 RepID=UPI001FADF9EF|nr:hypothetical protein [Clostridium sp. C2-6-12]
MEDKLFEKLNDLNMKDTKLLLEGNIDLSMESAARKRIEKAVIKKAGYNEKQSQNKINHILGGILMKKKIALSLSAAFVLSLAGGGYAYAKTPIAYVSVDINPSVELGVNAFDTVVSVEAYNEDGSNILADTNLLNVKVDEAVSTVVTNAINDGYIKEDGSSAIEITTSTDKTKVAAELDETLKDVVDKTLNNNNVEAEVETQNVALARRDEARKLGITPGKLNLIQKLQALDPAITVDEYKNSSVKDIQKKAKEIRKNGIIETSTQDSTSAATTATDATTSTSDNTTTTNTSESTAEAKAGATVSTKASTNEEAITQKENKKTTNDKSNNGSSKKEEINTSQEKISEPVVEKQNKSENSNSQSSNNSSKEDKNVNIKSDSSNSNSSSKPENISKGSSSKSENNSKESSSKSDNGGGNSSNSSNSGNGASSSQGKGKK